MNARPPAILAVDFGTSNSLVAAAIGTEIRPPLPIDPDHTDPTVMRSLVYFPHRDQAFYGQRAIREFIENDLHGRFLRSFKRFLPMRSFIGTHVESRPLNLEDLIGLFLKEIRERAEKALGCEADSVVLGRPARFDADEATDRFAEGRLEKSARTAGFKHIEFLPEPVAAAKEYGAASDGKERIVLVADFGGGTSDFSVIRISRKRFGPDDVLAIGGVSVAGDAMDASLMRDRVSSFFGSKVRYRAPMGSNELRMPASLMENLCSPPKMAILGRRDYQDFLRQVQQWSLGPDDRAAMDRLFTLIEDQLGFNVFEAIEKTKRELSSLDESPFEFSYPGIDIRTRVTRTEFEDYSSRAVRKIIDSLDSVLKDSAIPASRIDSVCCTGGTARVPALHRALVERFGKERLRERKHYHAVVEGLAGRAAELAE